MTLDIDAIRRRLERESRLYPSDHAALFTEIEQLRGAVAKNNAEIDRLQQRAKEYKDEWESACERLSYSEQEKAEAVAAENEACAKIPDDLSANREYLKRKFGIEIRDAIRARTEQPVTNTTQGGG